MDEKSYCVEVGVEDPLLVGDLLLFARPTHDIRGVCSLRESKESADTEDCLPMLGLVAENRFPAAVVGVGLCNGGAAMPLVVVLLFLLLVCLSVCKLV